MACGAVGGMRGLGAGPCGGDLDIPEGATGAERGGACIAVLVESDPCVALVALEELGLACGPSDTGGTVIDVAVGGGSIREELEEADLLSDTAASAITLSTIRSALGPVGGRADSPVGGRVVFGTVGMADGIDT